MAETKQKATKATETTKKQETPKRVYFKEHECSVLKRDYKAACGMLQAVIDGYNQLGAGEATGTVFRGIIHGKLGPVQSDYLKKMESEIQETTKNTLLASKLKAMVEEPFTQWTGKVSEAMQGVEMRFNGAHDTFPKYLHWEYIQFEDGKVTFNEKAVEDDCSVYLDTEHRKKFYELAEETAKKLTELQKLANESAGGGIPATVINDTLSADFLFHYNEGGEIGLTSEFMELI